MVKTFGDLTVVKQYADQFRRLRGERTTPPDLSIIIPVNAQGDLETVFGPLSDIVGYNGRYQLEIILVINNYPEAAEPPEIETFRQMGLCVVGVPSARRSGEVVIISARALGVMAAAAEATAHFDADCRIGNIDALVDWYVRSLRSNYQLAYSHVGYYELRPMASVYVKIGIHHLSRWVKRVLFQIPVTRGSNYAIEKLLFLQLYRAGKLSVDLQVGPAAKLAGAKIIFSRQRRYHVYTSGRRFKGGWDKLLGYFRYRLRYNLKATPRRRKDVRRTSWEGFDQESERRKTFTEKDAV
ncbi:MAG: glycosyltransferase [Chloroflexota bacterium]